MTMELFGIKKIRLSFLAGTLCFYLLSYLGCLYSASALPWYYGLIIGLGTLVLTIPVYLALKKRKVAVCIIFAINAFATGLSMGNYYSATTADMHWVGILVGAAAGIVLLVATFAFSKSKVSAWQLIVWSLIILAFLGVSIAGWICWDKGIFSYITFSVVIGIAFLSGYGLTENKPEKTLPNLCASSYTALGVVSLFVILALAIAAGDCDCDCDCTPDCDCGSGGARQKRTPKLIGIFGRLYKKRTPNPTGTLGLLLPNHHKKEPGA